jgi:hypothetical protein
MWKTDDDFTAIYASDHDMFAFLCNSEYRVAEEGNPDGLRRGIIVENSEVGASSLRFTKFLFREMCSNHIIWGASRLVEIKVRHVGDARQRWYGYQAEITKYLESSASEDEAKISLAKTKYLGNRKDEVLDKLFGMKSLQLTRKVLEGGYDATVPDQDGSPLTQWGIVQGLTRYSQGSKYADERTAIDKAAGRVLEAEF